MFLEDLFSDVVAKKSKDPFGTIRVAGKALSKIRELQRGVPPPYGEAFSRETLIGSASSKALAATTEARLGPDADPLRDGFQVTSLDQDEVERILDACIVHSDHWSGFKVAAMGWCCLGPPRAFELSAVTATLQSDLQSSHIYIVTSAAENFAVLLVGPIA
ncbi:TPA: hypothetical protein ACH3X1_002971 [Trebouxia sp. C0004]